MYVTSPVTASAGASLPLAAGEDSEEDPDDSEELCDDDDDVSPVGLDCDDVPDWLADP
jgi:hypothetical protein